MVIGFFMPLPLAMMIPFMGIQSMVMAKQFGENFQYGKRRISAMSNDEFNALTPAKLLSNANDELKSQIPLMEASMRDMRDFQQFIVKEFLLTIRSIIDAGLGKLIGLSPTEINQTVQNIEHFLHGHFEGHGVTEPTTPTPEGIIPPEELKEVSIDTVRGWDDTRLFHEYNNKLNTYNAKSRLFIKQIFDIRILNLKRRPFVPSVPINTLKPTREFVITKAEFTMLPQLTITRMNKNIKNNDFRSVFLILASLRASAVKRLKGSRISNAQKIADERMLRQIDKLIIIMNDLLKISGGLRT